ncbi:hypothetical protein AX15_005162 [Amanita polypyramis BW_CC]|nr:hypothetical protein AX15_005162 [Amanita polypyramis BW_CC]
MTPSYTSWTTVGRDGWRLTMGRAIERERVPRPGMLKSPPPLRTKRNFKSLQLSQLEPIVVVVPPGPGPIREPVADRPAPAPVLGSLGTSSGSGSPRSGEKRRPPPLADKLNLNAHTALGPGDAYSPGYQGSTPAAGRSRSAIQASLSNTLARLDIKGSGARFDFKNEDLKSLQELGHGNGGSVVKVEHVPTGTIMAKKIVLIDAKPSVRKQILRELQIIHECNSPNIISSYGAFLAEPNICICMEYMDKGSFDGIYKKIGAIDMDVVAKVALSVLQGLMYLYDVHRIIHRDIKPSNILCNSQGEIKLCDFGVSGELINSIAHTFVGTSIYMSPERIQGAEYSVKSDVWSLGITLIELANGRFPFSDSNYDDEDEDDEGGGEEIEGGDREQDLSQKKTPTHWDSSFAPTETLGPAHTTNVKIKSNKDNSGSKRRSTGVSLHGEGMTMSILELMHQIVNEPAPRLGLKDKDGGASANEFVDGCLVKVPEERRTPRALLGFEWMERARRSRFDLKAWTNSF